MSDDRDELARQIEEHNQKRLDDANEVSRILTECEHTDDDGYPTEDALLAIELWDWEYNGGSRGWFQFIRSIWSYNYWYEGWEDHEYRENTKVYSYAISTAGWSGNESIIHAMQRNKHMLWSMNWVSSRRGGHYTFELMTMFEDNQ